MLADLSLDIMTVVLPPFPANIGYTNVNQVVQNTYSPVKIGECSEERAQALSEYYVPKIGDQYTQAAPTMKCVNDESLFLQGEESYRT